MAESGDFLRYSVQPVESGYVEWQILGLAPSNIGVNSLVVLFTMWDPTAGDYTTNPFRVDVQKASRSLTSLPLRLRWISRGLVTNGASDFSSWNPATVYTLRVGWGPVGGSNTARLLLDGQEAIQVQYERPYRPNRHVIELGISAQDSSPIGATYRNFTVVRRDS